MDRQHRYTAQPGAKGAGIASIHLCMADPALKLYKACYGELADRSHTSSWDCLHCLRPCYSPVRVEPGGGQGALSPQPAGVFMQDLPQLHLYLKSLHQRGQLHVLDCELIINHSISYCTECGSQVCCKISAVIHGMRHQTISSYMQRIASAWVPSQLRCLHSYAMILPYDCGWMAAIDLLFTDDA